MNIKFVNIDRKDAYELIKENIYNCRTISTPITDTKFHHITQIQKVPQILKSGLLSKRKLVELEGRELTPQEINLYSYDRHVNGLDYIALSSVDIDFSQIKENSFYYDPFNTIDADIIISKDVKAFRNSYNYFNEFLVEGKIPPELFNAIDVRILKILEFDFNDIDKNKKENKINLMTKYYNCLRTIALTLKNNNLNVPLREVSDETITLSTEKVMRLPYILLK